MADVAVAFHWSAADMDVMEPDELLRWRTLAEARMSPQR